MICKRFLENRNFTPVPFWQIRVQTEKSGISFDVINREKYGDKETASAVFQRLQGNSLEVQSVEQKEINQEPSLLYDLTSLQEEANSKHGFSADKTLSIAQNLYEKKLITYPRTGSRYISADVFDEIPELIESLKTHPRFGGYVSKMDTQILNIHSVDDKKVTDHHTLLITGNSPKDLSCEEKTVYEMIAGRMLEAFDRHSFSLYNIFFPGATTFQLYARYKINIFTSLLSLFPQQSLLALKYHTSLRIERLVI